MALAVELDNLTYSYETSGSPRVLDGVSWKLEEGQTALLVGPSGCGKTSLLLTLNGLIPHDIDTGAMSGSVRVCGQDVATATVAAMSRLVGVVFQNPDEQLTSLYVEDEVAFGPENLNLSRNEVWQRIQDALTIVDLDHMRDKVVHGLSGGQKQRLAIAACLAMAPRLLLLDGPISNTDPLGSETMLEMIHTISRLQGLTTVIAEYDIDRILHLTDSVIVLDQHGRVANTGSMREVFEDDLPGDELGLWTPQVAEAGRELRRRGVALPRLPLTEIEAEEMLRPLLSDPAVPVASEADPPQRPTSAPVIQVDGLSHVYADGTVANRDISFDINAGEFVALVGQNGSGKTTCAMHLVGIHKPTHGRVIVGGRDTRRASPDVITREVAYVFQYPEHQFVCSTVRDELAFGLRRLGKLLPAEIERKVTDTLEQIGLTDKDDQHPYLLSIGEKRRLSVAAMTIGDPKILILDEPTYGQDRRFTYQLMDYIVLLNQRGTTVLFITHNMKLVAEFAKRVLIFQQGRLAFDGSPRHLFAESELLTRTHLSPPPIAALSARLFGTPALALSVPEFVDATQSRLTARHASLK